MGFSEGFTNGFSMVDTAMQRRRAIELDQEQQARTESHYQDALKRQGALDQQTIDWRKEDQGLAAADTAYKHGRDTIKDAHDEKQLDAEINDKTAMRGLQSQANDISRMNANNSAAHYKKLNEKADFELDYLKDQNLKTKATERAQNYFSKDQSGAMSINIPGGKEGIDALNDIGTAYGLNVKKVAADLGQHTQDINLLKSAMANDTVAFSKQNLPVVMDALNRVEAVDINKGSGLQADGITTITSKRIVGIHDIDASGNLVFEVESVGTQKGKDGKSVDYKNTAPMTKFRSSDPKDNSLRTVNRQQLVQRLEGQDAFGKILQSNPQFTQQINAIYDRSHEKDKKDNFLKLEKKVVDMNGVETATTTYFDPKSNTTIKEGPDGNIVRGTMGANNQSTANESTDKSINPQYQLAVQKLGQENADKAWDAWVLSIKK
jgi:hypothetical protein